MLVALPAISEFFLAFHPAFLLYAGYASITVPFLMWLVRGEPPIRRLSLAVGYVGALVGLWHTPWTSHKRFQQDLERVSLGSTVAEARAAMAAYPEGVDVGEKDSVGAGGDRNRALVYRIRATDGLASDLAVISIRDGRVTRAEIFRD